MKDFFLFFLFFFIFAFEQFQIWLFPDLIFFHLLHLLTKRSYKSLFFRVNEFLLCGDVIFHVVIFVVDEFYLWNAQTVLHAILFGDERMHVNLSPGNTNFWVNC